MSSECCGTCRSHVWGEVPGEGDWICNNSSPEEYGIETPYSYNCNDSEENCSQKGEKWEEVAGI